MKNNTQPSYTTTAKKISTTTTPSLLSYSSTSPIYDEEEVEKEQINKLDKEKLLVPDVWDTFTAEWGKKLQDRFGGIDF